MPDRDVDVLLIGGGIASASAAAELRAQGFAGTIMLATRELDAPYHRPPITKHHLSQAQAADIEHVHAPGWWEASDVELLTRAPVMSLDPEQRVAKVGREEVRYGQALVATGAMVRRSSAEGAHLEGIHYLRVPGNAVALRSELEQAERVLIVGGSYIATEVAASLASAGHSSVMVMQEDLPLERTFGGHVGQVVADELRARGVELHTGDEVVEFRGGERVTSVVLASGTELEADVVVVGIGATPDVMLARKAGLGIGESGGVLCDSALRTSAPDVFAAGDMCEFDSRLHGASVRVEHEEVAAAQGRLVARNMMGGSKPFTEVPYFWSDLADWLSLQYVGIGGPFDRAEVEPGDHEHHFSVRYSLNGHLTGVCSVGDAVDLDEVRKELRLLRASSLR